MQSYKVTVAMTAALSLVVFSNDAAEAEEGAREALFGTLDAAGIGYQVEWSELDGVVEVDDAEERHALEEAGWRMIEQRADGVCFIRDDGRESKAPTWLALAAELLAEV